MGCSSKGNEYFQTHRNDQKFLGKSHISRVGLWAILNIVDKGRGNILVIEMPQKDQNIKGVHMNDWKDTAIKNSYILIYTLCYSKSTLSAELQRSNIG